MSEQNGCVARVVFNQAFRYSVIGAAAALALMAVPAKADPVNLVQNGSFENTVGYGSTGSIVTNTSLPGWQISGCQAQCTNGPNNVYAFLLEPNYTTAGTYVPEYNALFTFNGGGPGVSADGGNAYSANSNFQVGTLSQTISGLNVGDTYQLSFYQAAAEISGQSDTTASSWQVSLGSQTQNSASMVTQNGSYSNWVQDTLDFTATSTSEVLSFLATTNSYPPFLLLDGVSLTQVPVPEPASIALVTVGVFGLVAARRKRRAA